MVLVWLLLELADLQSPQVKKEDKTGPHRHKQVPLLGLHVCCGGGVGGVEDVAGRERGRRGRGTKSKDSVEDGGTGKVQRSLE